MDPLPIATPALLIDVAQVDRNIRRVAGYAARHDLEWRPHVKTHKSPWIAAHQLAGGATGLSCATPREAEVMREATDNMLLAYPPIGADRLRRTASLAASSRLGVMLDSPASAEAMSVALHGTGASVRVLVELDVGLKRTGVADVTEAIALATRIDGLPGLVFDGFGFYPGNTRSAGPESDPVLASLTAMIAELIEGAARVGLAVNTISCGSTPLLWRSHEVVGTTEIRAGTAIYFDRTSVFGGVCGYDECAATILTTVVSTAVPGQIVVDAGLKAVGREVVRGANAPGHASVVGHPELALVRPSEEHGIIELNDSAWRPAVGDQLRVIPNHICIAVHNFDEMHCMLGDGKFETLPVAARGR